MRSFLFSITTVILAGLVAAQEHDPAAAAQITPAPTGLPFNETITIWGTPLLKPDDPDYVTPEEDQVLRKRTPPAGVYMCENKNWLGKCNWVPMQESVCMNYPFDAGSSFGPSRGWQCIFYYTAPCEPASTDGKLTYPGTPNLGSVYKNELKPTSYRCRPCPQSASCVNNDAPDWIENTAKRGYMASDGKCYRWNGKWKWTTCIGYVPPPTTSKKHK